MRVAVTPKHNQAASDFLAAAQALPVLDMALATEAAAMPLLLDELQQAQSDEVNAPAQDFQAVADNSTLAAYVAPPVTDMPLLLAQASGGLGETRGSSQGQVAGRATPNQDEDDKGAWWWVGGLGLLALAAGGGSGSSSNDTPNGPTDPRTQVNFDSYTYTTPINASTITVNKDDASNGTKVNYSGKEANFGFSVSAPASDSAPAQSASFDFSYDPGAKLATLTWTVNGTSESTEAYFDEATSSFSAWLITQLSELGTNPTATGSNVTFGLNGFTYTLSLDNSGGNGNLINALTVSYTGGAFQLTTSSPESTATFDVGSDAFAAGTSLVLSTDVTSYLSAEYFDHFVAVNDLSDIQKIDMRAEQDGVQILVYSDLNDGKYTVVTLSEQPISYEQLFINNSYTTYSPIPV